MILHVEHVPKCVHVAARQRLHHVLEIILCSQFLRPFSNVAEVVLWHGMKEMMLDLVVEEDEPPIVKPAWTHVCSVEESELHPMLGLVCDGEVGMIQGE